VIVLFDSADNQTTILGRHRYAPDDIQIAFLFGIDALDTLTNFDATYEFGSPTGLGIEFDAADIAGTLIINDFVARGSATEIGSVGGGSCPVYEFLTLPGSGAPILGRNGGTLRPSDGVFDCRSFAYQARSGTLESTSVAEPGMLVLAGFGLISVVGFRRRHRRRMPDRRGEMSKRAL
jgi:hypothetical protein